MSILISILGILITIFLVVGFHEFGHFIVARLCGIKVLRFSIGFGKSLFRWTDKKGTEYVIAAIPLGGYVKMVDENEESVSAADLPKAFNRQSIFKRLAVICAGPFSNIIFALILYWLLFVIGFTTVKPVIGQIIPNSIAAEAGLKPQEEIIKVDHDRTLSWNGVIIKFLEHAGSDGMMTLETENVSHQSKLYTLNLAKWKLDELNPDPLGSLGISPYQPTILPVIDEIQPNSPAAIAGLKPKDKILSINQQKITDWMEVAKIVYDAPEQTLLFHVLRDNKKISMAVTIGEKHLLFSKKHGYLGVLPAGDFPKELLRQEQYGPFAALPEAYNQVKILTEMNFIMIGKLIMGKISLKSLGGPITIFETAGKSLNVGIIPFMSFLAFLSIAIGVINIFPIPGLDGGHVLFQGIEFVIRKPLPMKLQMLLYRLGLILLLLLIIQALTNDILRLA